MWRLTKAPHSHMQTVRGSANNARTSVKADAIKSAKSLSDHSSLFACLCCSSIILMSANTINAILMHQVSVLFFPLIFLSLSDPAEQCIQANTTLLCYWQKRANYNCLLHTANWKSWSVLCANIHSCAFAWNDTFKTPQWQSQQGPVQTKLEWLSLNKYPLFSLNSGPV